MSKKSKGLGDTIEKITEFTGIKKLVESVNGGEECSPCQRRQEFLNKLIPYKDSPIPLKRNEGPFLEGTYIFVKNASTTVNGEGIIYNVGTKIKIKETDDLYEIFQTFYELGILQKQP